MKIFDIRDLDAGQGSAETHDTAAARVFLAVLHKEFALPFQCVFFTDQCHR